MRLRSTLLAALAVGLVSAAPATAGPGFHDGDRASGFDGASAPDRSDVPSRIANRVKRAKRALNRAEDQADDGNAAAAATALGAARRNLAAAKRSANRRVQSDSEKGPAAVWAVSGAQHSAVTRSAGMYDEADPSLEAAITETLNAAIDGRDELIASIAGLDSDSQADYGYVLGDIDEDLTDEIETIDDVLADDTLSSDAQAALAAARDKLVASQAAVETLLDGIDSSSFSETAADEGDGGGCDGRRGDSGDDSSSEDSSTASRQGTRL